MLTVNTAHQPIKIFVVMHEIICVLESVNFMLFLIKFIKFKQRIKFKKFELHNYAAQCSFKSDQIKFYLLKTHHI